MSVNRKIKRTKKKVYVDPWAMLPDFEDDKNFPLVVEEEDSFGNRRRMIMDHNMKLVPIVEDKENIATDYTSDGLSKQFFENIGLPSGSDNKNDDDDFKFSSPFVVERKKKRISFNDSNKIKNQEKEKVIKEKTLKGILKNKDHDIEGTISNYRSSFTDKMMFSSPIIKGTPSGNQQSKDNKKILLEKLQNCKETPILATGVSIKIDTEDSLDYFTKDKPNSVLKDDIMISMLKEVHNVQVIDSSCDLFSNEISVKTQDTSSFNKSENTNIFYKPFPVLSKKDVMEISFQNIDVQDRKRWLQLAKRRSRLIKRKQGLNDSFWNIYQVEDSLSVIFKLCQTPNIQTFAKVFPVHVRKDIIKLGEGSFGEVFMLKDTDNVNIVVKFIPVESNREYNGAAMTTYEDVLSEIVIAKELADLSLGTINRCKNFVQMSSVNNVAITRGKFPSYFQTVWDKANKIKQSENDNPKTLGSKQEWILLKFHFAGSPLEDFNLKDWKEAYSILTQVALSLACAENHMEFEHRDLHLGNVLVLRSDDAIEETYIVGGLAIRLQLSGVYATIIDFTFSRINKDGNVVFVDLSKDNDLFLGTGDIQFDVYREMQVNNKNDWCTFNPKSNILWLHFLGMKLTEKLTNSDLKDDSFRSNFKEFHRKIISFSSADK